MTPLELHLLMEAQVERNHDEMQREAVIAIMHEKAHREKRPKADDLYRRPDPDVDRKLEEKAEQVKHAEEWLAQFEFE